MSKKISMYIFTIVLVGVLAFSMQFIASSVASAEELVKLEIRTDPHDGIIIFWGESNEPDVTGYTILWRVNSDSWNRVDLGQQPDYVLNELIYFSTYEFQVLVRYSEGTESEYSHITSFNPN